MKTEDIIQITSSGYPQYINTFWRTLKNSRLYFYLAIFCKAFHSKVDKMKYNAVRLLRNCDQRKESICTYYVKDIFWKGKWERGWGTENVGEDDLKSCRHFLSLSFQFPSLHVCSYSLAFGEKCHLIAEPCRKCFNKVSSVW